MELMLIAIPRKVAKERGIRRYVNTYPCRKGHFGEHNVKDKKCRVCVREYQRTDNSSPEKKAKRAEYDRQRWINDREYFDKKNRDYYAKNTDAVNAQKREYAAENKHWLKKINAVWRANNPHIIRELNAKRRVEAKRATPPWADSKKIRLVYEEAFRLQAETGIEHHVDHIIPLKAKLVCGLHVHQNLQPLPWDKNLSKKNNFVVTPPLVDDTPVADQIQGA